jgi:hypothetical protein
MSVYLKLLHGRDDPNQDMHDWGFNGPVLGPFEAVHFTYCVHVRCFWDWDGTTRDALELSFTDDMLTYEGKHYGDFEIATSFGSDTPAAAAHDPAGPELLEALVDQTEAAQAVIDAWAEGDLAAAVRWLDASTATARAAVAKAKGGAQ